MWCHVQVPLARNVLKTKEQCNALPSPAVLPRQCELLPRFHLSRKPHKFAAFTSQACLQLLFTLNANEDQKQNGFTACVPQSTAPPMNVSHCGKYLQPSTVITLTYFKNMELSSSKKMEVSALLRVLLYERDLSGNTRSLQAFTPYMRRGSVIASCIAGP